MKTEYDRQAHRETVEETLTRVLGVIEDGLRNPENSGDFGVGLRCVAFEINKRGLLVHVPAAEGAPVAVPEAVMTQAEALSGAGDLGAGTGPADGGAQSPTGAPEAGSSATADTGASMDQGDGAETEDAPDPATEEPATVEAADGSPSAADLDAVAAEAKAAEETTGAAPEPEPEPEPPVAESAAEPEAQTDAADAPPAAAQEGDTA
jgi:hypothetical protein